MDELKLGSEERVQRAFRIRPAVDKAITARAKEGGTTKEAALEAMVCAAAGGEARAPVWLPQVVGTLEEAITRARENFERQLARLTALHEALSSHGDGKVAVLQSSAAQLADLAETHRAWLAEHQRALSETHDTVAKAVSELQTFGKVATSSGNTFANNAEKLASTIRQPAHDRSHRTCDAASKRRWPPERTDRTTRKGSGTCRPTSRRKTVMLKERDRSFCGVISTALGNGSPASWLILVPGLLALVTLFHGRARLPAASISWKP